MIVRNSTRVNNPVASHDAPIADFRTGKDSEPKGPGVAGQCAARGDGRERTFNQWSNPVGDATLS